MKVINIKIQNGISAIVLNFDEDSGRKFLTAVKNCLELPKTYPFIEYEDKKETIFFTAEYLKNSLISIPK